MQGQPLWFSHMDQILVVEPSKRKKTGVDFKKYPYFSISKMVSSDVYVFVMS